MNARPGDARAQSIGRTIQEQMDARREAFPKDELEVPLPAGYQPKQPYQEAAHGPLPVHRVLEWPANDDKDLEFLLGLETLIARSMDEGVEVGAIITALEYVRQRPRSGDGRDVPRQAADNALARHGDEGW